MKGGESSAKGHGQFHHKTTPTERLSLTLDKEASTVQRNRTKKTAQLIFTNDSRLRPSAKVSWQDGDILSLAEASGVNLFRIRPCRTNRIRVDIEKR